MRSSSIFIFFEVVFHFLWRSSFYFLPIFFWQSSILIFVEVVFHFFFFKVVFHFFWGRLSSWVKIRLHTENQLPRLSGSALKVPVWWGGVVASYPLLSQAPTPVEVELGCDNYILCINYLSFQRSCGNAWHSHQEYLTCNHSNQERSNIMWYFWVLFYWK